MSRNRASARKAGSAFEQAFADYFAEVFQDDRIERRARNGAKDRGDITGLRLNGKRVVVECKNTARTNLSTWAWEAEVEAGNDDADMWLIAHKRHGNAKPGDQWVTMTWEQLAKLTGGEIPE